MAVTVLEGPMGAPDQTFPEIRVRFGASSHYAPLDIPAAGDVDQKIANLVRDSLPGTLNPDQFVLVIGDGLAILPLNISGNELRLTLGAQVLDDLSQKLKQRVITARDRIVTVSRPELGCEDWVIGYKVLGRNKEGRADDHSGISVSAPGDAAGPFDGNFTPAFLESDSQTLIATSSGPTEWVEYLHGPLTFRCERADMPDVDPDALEPDDVESRTPSQQKVGPAGPFQTGRSQGGNGPFGPAFLEDGSGEHTAAEGDEA